MTTGAITIETKLVSSANAREHWKAAHRRKSQQRQLVALHLVARTPPSLPCEVLLTRVGKQPLDDDNLAHAFKSVRDEVAKWIGADDKPGSGITWRYAQTRGDYAIEVQWSSSERGLAARLEG